MSKKVIRIIFAIVLVSFLVFSAIGCGTGTGTEAVEEDIEVTKESVEEKEAVEEKTAEETTGVEEIGTAETGEWVSFENADMDWKQFEGLTLEVGLGFLPWQDMMMDRFADFTELTGIEITYQPIAGIMEYRTKRTTECIAGTFSPDVFMLCPSGFAPEFASNEWIVKMDDFMNDPTLTDPNFFDYNDFFTPAINYVKAGGDYHWTLPINASVEVMVARTDILDEVGATMLEGY